LTKTGCSKNKQKVHSKRLQAYLYYKSKHQKCTPKKKQR